MIVNIFVIQYARLLQEGAQPLLHYRNITAIPVPDDLLSDSDNELSNPEMDIELIHQSSEKLSSDIHMNTNQISVE